MLNNYKIGTRLFWQAVGMAFWFAVLVSAAVYYMSQLNQTANHLYVEKLEPGAIVQRIQTLMAENSLQIANGLMHDPSGQFAGKHNHPVSMHTETIVRNRDQINAFWEQFKARPLNKEEAELAQIFEKARTIYVRDGLLPAAQALQAGEFAKAGDLYLQNVLPAYKEASEAANELRQYYSRTGLEAKQEADGAFSAATKLLVAIALLVTALIAFFAYWFGRSITHPIAEAVAVADSIAGGNLDNHIVVAGKDEVANLNHALAQMQGDLRERIAAEQLAANENLRIKVALDVTSNSVMVANPEGQIIYCNASVLEMMRQAESDIRKDLPEFKADSILGANFDIYHKNPAYQRNMLAGLQGTHRTEIVVGGRYFALVACPIVNAQGDRLGTAVEWRDRTAEVLIEKEISDIINAAVAGDFSRRLKPEGMQGFFKQLSQGLNDFMDANNRALAEVGKMLASMSKGDLTERIDSNYQGSLGKLKNDANSTVDNLQEIINSIKAAADAINTAAQEIATGNQDLSSRTEQQASSLEETASSMEQLTSTVKHNADNAKTANDLAGSAQKVAERGGAVVDQVVETMSAIHQSSTKISDIIGVIDSIAFQTNILALNAAVEAARAGEQGRGFAVVATEVRNLAQRSAGAAKEIKALINDSVEKVEVGTKLVDRAGQTMDEIVGSIKRVAKIMTDIAGASREQSAGIEQVGLAVSQMDEMTQQNAALVEQAAAAAESLEEQAKKLSEAVSVFVLDKTARRRNVRVSMGESPAATRVANGAEVLQLTQQDPVRLSQGGHQPRIAVPAASDGDEWEEF